MNTAAIDVEVQTKFDVSVIYNGLSETFKVEDREKVATLREQAIVKFGPIPQPHLLGLFNEAGAELKDSDTIREAGVRPGAKLLLRPSSVRGGAE